jgi:hypothetical protein
VEFRSIALGALLSLTVISTSHADVIESNTPNGSGIGPIGASYITTFGEVFTVPTGGDTQLNSFSFYFQGTLSLVFAGVAAWTGTGAGPALYTSQPFAAAYGDLSFPDNYEQITQNTGGLSLVNGQEYVAYVSVAGLASSSGYDGLESGAGAGNDLGFVYDNSQGPNGTDWNGCQVPGCGQDYHLGYTMEFSQPNQTDVPEPATITLVGSGLVGLGAFRRRIQSRGHVRIHT